MLAGAHRRAGRGTGVAAGGVQAHGRAHTTGMPGGREVIPRGSWWRRQSLLPGWSAGRLWALSLAVCMAVAACDAATGPHLILIGLLICGPCCALLAGRWMLTAASGCFAVALGIVLGIPDQIFATVTQYAFLAAIAVVGTTATAGAAILQRRLP